jgi:nucleoside-diphosphate-sugar epimerase
MNYSVIGGSGFIGTVLCKNFNKRSMNFRVVDKRVSQTFPSKYIYADVRSVNNLNHAIYDNDVIINLAAEHRDNINPKNLYDQVNVSGAINICNIARIKNCKKIIFTSSVAVYGFAKIGTNENGIIKPFSDYGRTKWEAEQAYKAWQMEDPKNRTLVIIRPTVVFGERNRGNVFNLLKQIASGNFFMIGSGQNRKSMAYVENVAAFIEYSLNFKPGLHIYNYVDKPDFTMNALVNRVYKILGRSNNIRCRLPYIFGLIIGKLFDFISFITGKKFPISTIRIKKFCTNSVYASAVPTTGFKPPVGLLKAIERTVKYEFIEKKHKEEPIFFTE